jgi:glyoxylase-like metal-dependent hydrolase (beta-lactamase superfamily II)
MKKIILFITLSVFSFGMNYNAKPVKISESVHMFLGENNIVTKQNGGNIANTFWINTGKHYVIVDSGASYEYAKQVHNEMKKIQDLPIKAVFNTHMHDDHWMGNSYYKELNVPIYATKLQQNTFPFGASTRILNILNKDDLKGTKVVDVDHIIDKSFSMNVDGKEINIVYLKYAAHTKQDFMVFLPSESVLFTGDLLFSERLTSIRDGSVEGSLKSLKIIDELNPKVYANGHGKYIDKTAFNHMTEYLGDLKKAAMEAIEEDIGLDEFVKTADFSKYENYGLYDRLNKSNLDYAYREYEFFEEE